MRRARRKTRFLSTLILIEAFRNDHLKCEFAEKLWKFLLLQVLIHKKLFQIQSHIDFDLIWWMWHDQLKINQTETQTVSNGKCVSPYNLIDDYLIFLIQLENLEYMDESLKDANESLNNLSHISLPSFELHEILIFFVVFLFTFSNCQLLHHHFIAAVRSRVYDNVT